MSILIVDDNEANLYQLQVLLGGNGYELSTAAHGAAALEKARQHPPDLIISDILMPVMDGYALCREVKQDERLRQIPFIFYTATYTDERDREFALSLGAQQFIVKPEEPDAFLRTIREALQRIASAPPAPPKPAPDTPVRLPIEAPEEEEATYLKQYNEVLIRKLEAKMQQLELANGELERDIAERKRVEEALRQQAGELRASNQELTLFNRAAVGRELRMIELKQEVNELCRRLGETPRHATDLSPPPPPVAAGILPAVAGGILPPGQE